MTLSRNLLMAILAVSATISSCSRGAQEIVFVGNEEATAVYSDCAERVGQDSAEVSIASGTGAATTNGQPGVGECLAEVDNLFPPLSAAEHALSKSFTQCLVGQGFNLPIGAFTIRPAANGGIGLQVETGTIAIPESLEEEFGAAVAGCRDSLE